MQFQKGKPLRILQIADTQESDIVAGDTLKLINAALDQVQPDLVVLTGDQIKGYSPKFIRGEYRKRVQNTINTLVEPMVRRGIAFAPTFGNHDAQGRVKKKEQMQFYAANPTCVPVEPDSRDCGTYTVPVYSSDGSKVALNLYIIDSNGDKGGGYEPVRPEQIAWYQQERERLRAENGGYVPSMVFQHIPVPEYYDILKRVPKGSKHALRAWRTHKNEYYVLDEDKVWQQEFFLEPPSTPDENTGEFAALREKGDVFALFVGHDHKNSFVGKKDGIDLGYTPGAGFNVYGPGVNRAVRVFEIEEEHPRTYSSYTLSFKALVGKQVSRPFKNFLFDHAPSNKDVVIAAAVKAVYFAAGAALLGGILYYVLP